MKTDWVQLAVVGLMGAMLGGVLALLLVRGNTTMIHGKSGTFLVHQNSLYKRLNP